MVPVSVWLAGPPTSSHTDGTDLDIGQTLDIGQILDIG
jgi:hypothetical protein